MTPEAVARLLRAFGPGAQLRLRLTGQSVKALVVDKQGTKHGALVPLEHIVPITKDDFRRLKDDE